MHRLTLGMIAVLAFSAACTQPAEPPPPSKAGERAANEAAARWQAKHETDYRRDWVSITGLYDLKPGVNTAGSAPTNDIVLPASVSAKLGRFVVNAELVRFEPAPGAHVKHPVDGSSREPAGNGAYVSPTCA